MAERRLVLNKRERQGARIVQQLNKRIELGIDGNGQEQKINPNTGRIEYVATTTNDGHAKMLLETQNRIRVTVFNSCSSNLGRV